MIYLEYMDRDDPAILATDGPYSELRYTRYGHVEDNLGNLLCRTTASGGILRTKDKTKYFGVRIVEVR